MAAVRAEIDGFRRLAPAAARKNMAERLQRQIQYFGARGDGLPEWREAARIQDPDELWRQWPSLPILTKKDLKSRFQPGEISARFGLKGNLKATGGSTGEPTQVLHDKRMVELVWLSTIYWRLAIGWRPGIPTISIWGSDRDIGKSASTARLRFISSLKNERAVSGFEIDGAVVENLLRILAAQAPVVLYGYSSFLEHTARKILVRGDLPDPGAVQTAWASGETLYESQSKTFERAFGAPLLSVYGGREMGLIGTQILPLGPHILNRPYIFLEIVDENGRPCGPGVPGRILATSTVCRGTPFLRYDVGDLGSRSEGGCDESGIREIAQLHGRVSGLLELPNGRTISNIFWNHLLKEFPEIHQFQLALIDNQRLELRLRGERLNPVQESGLRSSINRFAAGVPLVIKWVERFDMTREGKLMHVVRESVPG